MKVVSSSGIWQAPLAILVVVLVAIVLTRPVRPSSPPPAAVAAASPIGTPAVPLRPRKIVFLVNRDGRNPWRIEADRVMEAVIRGCAGPGDTIEVIYVTNRFVETENVRLRLALPPLPASLLENGVLRTAETTPELNRLQVRLNASWRGVAALQEAAVAEVRTDAAHLVSSPPPAGKIELAGAFAYGVRELAETPARFEKYLIFFGPMEQRSGGGTVQPGLVTLPTGLAAHGVQFLNLFAAHEGDTGFTEYRSRVAASLAGCGIEAGPDHVRDRAQSAAVAPSSLVPPSAVARRMPRPTGF